MSCISSLLRSNTHSVNATQRLDPAGREQKNMSFLIYKQSLATALDE